MPVSFGEGPLRNLAGQTAELLQPAVPYVVHAAASGVAFTIGLAGTQFAGAACRISCGNRILGGGMGLIGIGVASAMAGQAGIHCRHHFSTGQHPLSTPTSVAFRRKDLLLDACMGIALYKVMGGKSRNLMPSDLFKAGAMAHESLPALGKQYAGDLGRKELKVMMRRDGCHHCGKRKGLTVGDHIPPNKHVWGSSRSEATANVKKLLGTATGKLGATSKQVVVKPSARGFTPWRRLTEKLGLSSAVVEQRYYPQCLTCSQRQSVAVRANRRTLVLHYGGSKPWYWAGVLVGMRHFHSPASAGAVLMHDLQQARHQMQRNHRWKD